MKGWLLLFSCAALLIFAGCSNEYRELGVDKALNIDVGEGQRVMLMRTDDGVSVVYFRNNLDELGVEISGQQIEIQRKEVVGGESFLTITDSANLVPKMRLQLGDDGNIKRKEVITGWRFEEVGSGNQE